MAEVTHEPITPMVDGKPPGWVVACLDCEFSVDAHGPSAEDAVTAVAPQHEAGHRLIARKISYAKHPLYRR